VPDPLVGRGPRSGGADPLRREGLEIVLTKSGARRACAWRSIFWKAKTSPGKMITASAHVAPVHRSFPPSIPASGYYEWQDTATGKQPWYFTRADAEPMTFAGLWDEWKDKATGETLKSCTMVITQPNDFVAEVHDRMPVVLEARDFASWLNDGGPALLKPAANDVLQRWPVSRRVNSSRAPADDPTLIERVEVK
jgi:putative SOS response-associated peptidase YedK